MFEFTRRVSRPVYKFLYFYILIWITIFFQALYSSDSLKKSDAIIVLTGGKEGRIEHGIELMNLRYGDIFFISGVESVEARINEAEVIPKKWREKYPVVLGPKAFDTIGNMREINEWIREYGLKSIILVTSTYHMPRVRMLAYFYLPQDIQIGFESTGGFHIKRSIYEFVRFFLTGQILIVQSITKSMK